MSELKFADFSEDNWFVSDDMGSTGKVTRVQHYCGGKVATRMHGVVDVDEPLKKWFQPTEGWDNTSEKLPTCKACGEEVPENLIMMLTLSNTDI